MSLPIRTTARTAVLTLLPTALLAAGLNGSATASADPSALYPLTSGAAGNYSYDVQVGPGTAFSGGPAICTRVAMSHVTSTEPDSFDSCRATRYDTLVGDRRVLLLEGHFMAAGEDPIFAVDMYGTTPKAQRLKVTVSGRKAVSLKRSSSKVLSISGERVRFFHFARVEADPRKADSVKAQKKKCRKIRGKKKCSWKTIADQDYFLLP